VLPQNGENSVNNVTCQTCGTGCSFGCTAGTGTSGGNLLIYLNGDLIIELVGGQGGFGAYAGTPQCANGASGANGFINYLADYCIETLSSFELSTLPSVRAIY
jgi:hypothetical protein